MNKLAAVLTLLVLSSNSLAGNALGGFGEWLEDCTGIRDVTKPLGHVTRESRVETAGPILKNMIIESRNDALRTGTHPIPSHIKKYLRRYFPDNLLSKVRYRVGQEHELSLQANSFRFGDASAITLGHDIVFKDSHDSQNINSLGAHELAHEHCGGRCRSKCARLSTAELKELDR